MTDEADQPETGADTREIDRLSGLAADPRVRTRTGPATQRVTIERAPDTIAELAAGRPVTVPGLGAPAGEPIVTATLPSGERVTLAGRTDDGVELAFAPDPAIRELMGRAALTPAAPLTARLPVSYRLAPAWLRRRVRDLAVARRRRTLGDGFPAWPVEPSVEVLRAVYVAARRALGAEPRPAWPDGRRFALVLTHDVDDPTALRTAHALAADETEHGLRSAWYVVGVDGPPDLDGLGALHAAGHEIALHDAHHDNRGPFLEPAALGARLDGCAALIERFAMRGYRSPSMLRTPALYAALAGRFAYDTSMPDTGLLPARNGCATVLPLAYGGVPVLPLTLPSDGQLLSLGLDAAGIAERWIAKAEWVRRAGGVAMVLTHPEPGFAAEPAVRAAYRRFLAWAAAQDDAWHALPHEVAACWAGRPAASLIGAARS